MTGRELVLSILTGNLLDKNVVIWNTTKGRQRILSIDTTGDPKFGEIEIVTDGEVAD